MQRLTGMDATFLYMETPSAYMHVAGLMVLDPSTVEGGFTMDSVREFYGSRLHLAAPFRRRLVEIPMGLHHPLWVEDPDFDLDTTYGTSPSRRPGARSTWPSSR